MAVNNNNNTDLQSTTTLNISDSLLSKLSPGQRKLINVLAANPDGLLSSELSREIAISNKSNLIHFKLRMALGIEGLEIHTQRVSRQWLWMLRPIQTLDRVAQ